MDTKLISKLETGDRRTARLAIIKLAPGIHEGPGALTGKANRIQRVGETGSLQARDAITTPGLLPGPDLEDQGEPSDPAELWRAVERAYFIREFGALVPGLPPLLLECRAARSALGPGMVAGAYRLAACLWVHPDKDDVALIGAERGRVPRPWGWARPRGGVPSVERVGNPPVARVPPDPAAAVSSTVASDGKYPKRDCIESDR